MNIIGISANFHDSSCCLMQSGELVGAVSEERFSRIKNDARLPLRAFHHLLKTAGLSITDIDCIAYYEDPFEKLSRQLASNHNNAFDTNLDWLDPHKPFRQIREVMGYEGEIKFYDHHLSHAAGSYFFSGFNDAAILTSDGVGEWATTTFGHASDKTINLFREIRYPNSVGLLYSTITNFLGFKVLSGEYKVMGLAPYGKPNYVTQLRELFSMPTPFEFKLDMNYFDLNQTNRMYTEALAPILKLNPRVPESAIEQKHKDLARSLQVVLEEILLAQVAGIKEKTGSNNLCMSGGVALNCVANRAIRKQGLFENIYVAPASGDAGSALGAAALAHIDLAGERHSYQTQEHMYLGPEYSDDDIYDLLASLEVPFFDFREDQAKLLESVVDHITDGKVIGWFQGRMEFGPRGLGARSILADPRSPHMRDQLNLSVKKREAFRPFAPAILEEHMAEHLDLATTSPFMLETCGVKSKLNLPAITHVDGSCRPQTVSKKTNPKFHALIDAFYQRTQCPILINTSFNVRGEPVVCSPLDALRCFGNSGIDILVVGNFLIDRKQLPELFITMAERESIRIKPSDFFKTTRSEAVYTFI